MDLTVLDPVGTVVLPLLQGCVVRNCDVIDESPVVFAEDNTDGVMLPTGAGAAPPADFAEVGAADASFLADVGILFPADPAGVVTVGVAPLACMTDMHDPKNNGEKCVTQSDGKSDISAICDISEISEKAVSDVPGVPDVCDICASCDFGDMCKKAVPGVPGVSGVPDIPHGSEN